MISPKKLCVHMCSAIYSCLFCSRKAEKTTRAIECFKSSLKHNPLLWSSFETLCTLGNFYYPNIWVHEVSCIKNPKKPEYTPKYLR